MVSIYGAHLNKFSGAATFAASSLLHRVSHYAAKIVARLGRELLHPRGEDVAVDASRGPLRGASKEILNEAKEFYLRRVY